MNVSLATAMFTKILKMMIRTSSSSSSLSSTKPASSSCLTSFCLRSLGYESSKFRLRSKEAIQKKGFRASLDPERTYLFRAPYYDFLMQVLNLQGPGRDEDGSTGSHNEHVFKWKTRNLTVRKQYLLRGFCGRAVFCDMLIPANLQPTSLNPQRPEIL